MGAAVGQKFISATSNDERSLSRVPVRFTSYLRWIVGRGQGTRTEHIFFPRVSQEWHPASARVSEVPEQLQ